MINWTEIITTVCVLLITGIIIPLVNAKIKEVKGKMTVDQLATAEYWTEVSVRWAKQWLQSESGEKKKDEVMTFLVGKLSDLGIKLSLDEIDKLIESVYEQVKKELQ